MIKNREEAAIRLAALLKKYKDENPVVLAIPRGGVPIGYAVAKELKAPLDIALSKKIGHPFHKEYAIGSVSMEESIIDNDIVDVSEEYLQSEIKKIKESLKEKYKLFKGEEEPVSLKNKIVIITDDGIATGNTMMATVLMVKKQNPHKIILAIPVASEQAVEMLKQEVDEIITLLIPPIFFSVGQFYENFEQTNDETVIKLLQMAR